MRKATYTMVAASVTLALAGAAQALTSRPGAPTPMTAAPTAISRTGTGTTTTGTGTTTTGTTGTNGNAGSSGTTTGTTGGNVTFTPTGSTSGVSQVGTSTGSALVDAQNANLAAQFDTRGAATGAQTATTATSAVNGVGVGTSPSASTAAGNVFGGSRGGLVITDNGTGTAGVVNGVNANGERVGVQADLSSISPNATEAPEIQVLAAPNVTAAEVNVMERRELHKRRNLGRDRQLLYSIAPRTSVDRSGEAPNDPVTPALTPPR